MSANKLALILPAFQPSEQIIDIARKSSSFFEAIIVVDDGSDLQHRKIFETLKTIPKVTVLRHATNLGKGQALKYAFNFALVHYPTLTGVITADADGQHKIEDIVKVAKHFETNPDTLVMGSREFRQDVPLRSRFGNILTKHIFRYLTGRKLQDTQTGLRAIPAWFLPRLLKLKSMNYEFELDMLILANSESRMKWAEVPIQTIYEDNNASSHFNPILDSLKIYFVFFRFLLSSIATSIIDTLVFASALAFGANILTSTLSGRFVAGAFNFFVAKKLVFHSKGALARELSKYVCLVLALSGVTYAGIQFMTNTFGTPIIVAKIVVETFLFFLSFSAQRLYVFKRDFTKQTKPTNWDEYYAQPAKAAQFTRNITTSKIIKLLEPYAKNTQAEILEWGGANSCFYSSLKNEFNPKKYIVCDLNHQGLTKFNNSHAQDTITEAHQSDVLNPDETLRNKKVDICYSVGLIEHFDKNNTAAAIRTHFDCTRAGGIVLITFPTPTWLYTMTRSLAELLGIWKFHDERPLGFEEVEACMEQYGEILYKGINWPIVLTQGMILAKAHDNTSPA